MNTNREFRKIKSLQFLYEINNNGTILRNVKSKKHILIQLDSTKQYYIAYVYIKGNIQCVFIHEIIAECWLGKKYVQFHIEHIDKNSHNNDYRNLRYVINKQPLYHKVCLIKDKRQYQFNSYRQASIYIAKILNINVETVRKKFKQKRKCIYDYKIVYEKTE